MNNSVTKAIQLLEELAKAKEPVALRDLARVTHLNKATAYRFLHALCQKGFAQNIASRGIYALGPQLLALAEEYRRSFTMRDRVLPYLEQLVRATGETAIYCERYQQDGCVTIERRESPHQTRTVIETGVPRTLYAGSSALAILAMLPQEEILSVLRKRPLEKFTPHTPTSVQSDPKKARSDSSPWLCGERARKIFVHCRYRRALCLGTKCLRQYRGHRAHRADQGDWNREDWQNRSKHRS